MPKAKAAAQAAAQTEDTPQSAPMSTETRSVTIDGVAYTWTEATEDTVPEEARLVYARAQAAGG